MSRGIRTFVVLCVGVGALSPLVLSSGSASAAAVPCVQTYTGAWEGGRVIPGSGRPINVEVPTSETTPEWTRVADVTVQVRLESAPQNLELDAHHGFSGTTHLTTFAEPPVNNGVDLTFDDSAGPRQPGQTSGVVRPAAPLGRYVGDVVTTTGRASWQVIVFNPSSSTEAVTPISATFTFTLADCDTDGDGVLQSVDNCPTVANADQLDWDGDRVGNACDSTPGTAPVTPTSTPSPTPTTATPGTPTCTSGCAYVRTVGLRHVAKKHRLVGKVASVALGCRSEVPVTLWRKRSGADRKLKVVTTRQAGKYRTKAPVRRGRYYVSVGSAAEPLCGADTSRVVRVRR